jgi:glutathione peroxidase
MIQDYNIKTIHGDDICWEDYTGKKVMLVNVASECGLTPQYTELQFLHEKYGSDNFAVIGVPCNDFGGQEPGNESEIQLFCTQVYNANFLLTEKIHTIGEFQHPLYTYLTNQSGESVSWNFQKFLINSQGEVVKSISPKTSPTDSEIIQWIESND